jgi:phage terminase large subunit
MADEQEIRVKIPPIFKELALPYRYKSFYGGRGSSKSWSYARALLAIAATKKIRVLCTREFQSSIAESVHKLLSTQIEKLGLSKYYNVQKNSITSSCGSEFIFKGLRFNVQEIKSLEDISIAWVEEAQATSEESWQVLIPTIRSEGSEIWLSWNTGEAKDPTYQRFVVNPPPDCISKKVGWQDNPYFPEVLEKERLYCKRVDYENYLNIWEGEPLKISNANIFKGKYVEAEFEAPEGTRHFFGCDWGFSNDPTTLIRCYIEGKKLFIEYCAYGVGVELDELPQLFDSVPNSKEWPIKADNSRPETISYVKKKHGYKIEAAKKWPGSVEDGIAYLKKFEEIVVHSRCKHVLEEFKLYSYKTDSKTGEILPIIVDKHNHCIDAIRYSLDGLITNKGTNWSAFLGE